MKRAVRQGDEDRRPGLLQNGVISMMAPGYDRCAGRKREYTLYMKLDCFTRITELIGLFHRHTADNARSLQLGLRALQAVISKTHPPVPGKSLLAGQDSDHTLEVHLGVRPAPLSVCRRRYQV
jgi:transposase InsO family protein